MSDFEMLSIMLMTDTIIITIIIAWISTKNSHPPLTQDHDYFFVI